jgi:hypothetical protein
VPPKGNTNYYQLERTIPINIMYDIGIEVQKIATATNLSIEVITRAIERKKEGLRKKHAIIEA